jgi:hypothetical protein
VKISGETVIVKAVADPDTGDPTVLVGRAIATRDGINYAESEFFNWELEPVEANIDREFREAVYRAELARKGLGMAQAAQTQVTQLELFDDEEDDEDPEDGPLN